jgi:hypothetical protein
MKYTSPIFWLVFLLFMILLLWTFGVYTGIMTQKPPNPVYRIEITIPDLTPRETGSAQERRLGESYDRDKKQYDQDQKASGSFYETPGRDPMSKKERSGQYRLRQQQEVEDQELAR